MHDEAYPTELVEIENELAFKTRTLAEIELFRENYLKQLRQLQTHEHEDLKYNLNELEIAYNLLYVSQKDFYVLLKPIYSLVFKI